MAPYHRITAESGPSPTHPIAAISDQPGRGCRFRRIANLSGPKYVAHTRLAEGPEGELNEVSFFRNACRLCRIAVSEHCTDTSDGEYPR